MSVTHLAGEADVVWGAVHLSQDGGLGGRVPHAAFTVAVQRL